MRRAAAFRTMGEFGQPESGGVVGHDGEHT